jgi:hypothetical protein
MNNLFLFIISTIGMCHVIVDGSIMQGFRSTVKNIAYKLKVAHLGQIVDCYLCCGTWCGFLMGYIWVSEEPLKIFACGCAGGFISNFAAVFLNYLEAATIINMSSSSENDIQNKNDNDVYSDVYNHVHNDSDNSNE